jgi:hypothetical protein
VTADLRSPLDITLQHRCEVDIGYALYEAGPYSALLDGWTIHSLEPSEDKSVFYPSSVEYMVSGGGIPGNISPQSYLSFIPPESTVERLRIILTLKPPELPTRAFAVVKGLPCPEARLRRGSSWPQSLVADFVNPAAGETYGIVREIRAEDWIAELLPTMEDKLDAVQLISDLKHSKVTQRPPIPFGSPDFSAFQ